nr:filamentous hemagglutinin N-terminal domain-containing protein [Coleofasciculus sp. FACHB-125]
MSGAIASLGDGVLAQSNIVPDDTLIPESSLVTPSTPDSPVDVIYGGTQRGTNLFHSFLEFNVGEGRGAYFYSSSADIQNILARVTGGKPSEILGTIGTYGNSNPNLFLINPNGIIFRPNASLDMGNAGLNNPRPGGSFVATTANAVLLGDTGIFSASDPAASNLLTIDPSALFFNAISGQGIINQSTATTSVLGYSINGLQVPDGRSLLLVGGNVSVDRGRIVASGGRVELGGLAEEGTVGLEINGNIFSLNFQPNSLLSNVTLANNARVWVRGSGQGNIIVNANNFTATNGGALGAGTEGSGNAGDIIVKANDFSISGIGPSGLGSGLYNQTDSSGDAGNIFINTRTFNASSGAGVFSDSLTDGSGKGGNITIETERLTLRDGAEVRASTFSEESGGNLSVTASESLEVSGFSTMTGPSQLITQTSGLGAGTAGNLTIQTRRLLVRDGAQVGANTFGDGRGGNVSVTASESVELVGTSAVVPNRPFGSSGLFASSSRAGDAGNLTIQTRELTVRDGAMVSTRTNGRGSGGNLSVTASESVVLSGTSAVDSPSGLFSDNQGETGDAGDLRIQTRHLIIQDGAQVQAGTFGEGQGGKLEVFASGSVELSGSSPGGLPSGLLNETFGTGAAGEFKITTEQLIVRDSAVVSASTAGAGAAGNLTIQVRQLTIQDGGQVSAGTFDEGQGGKLEVLASESVELSGTSANGQLASGLYTQTEGTGAAGDLTVQTEQMTVLDGARVSTGTESSGAAGDLTIQTGRLAIRGGAQVGTGTLYGSEGSGGNLNVTALEFVEVSGISATGKTSGLFSQTQGTGAAGDLRIQTRRLIAQDGAQVSASTFDEGQGGKLEVFASESVEISGISAVGSPSGLFTETLGTGDAGDLRIQTGQLTVRDAAEVSVSSEETGQAGNLEVAALSILLDNQGAINAETASGDGGNITLRDLNLLLMRRNSKISTTAGTAQAGGNGGNIEIDADFIVAVPSENSDITANAFTGRGGNINITAQGIYGLDYRPRRTPKSDITASSDFGVDGIVEINTPDVDPSRGLAELPTISVDTEIAQGCSAGGSQAQSKFIITGRGGLPPNPGEALSTDAVQVDLVTLNPRIKNRSIPNISTNPTRSTPVPLVEAQGWVRGANGKVVLTANAPTVTPHRSWQRPPECSALQSNPKL